MIGMEMSVLIFGAASMALAWAGATEIPFLQILD